MFAVIEDGSRQYRVQQGDTLTVDYRADAGKGDTLSFDRVLLANGGGTSALGRPTIEGAIVEAQVLVAEEKGPKLEIQKIRRRKNSRRHTGHRQKYTSVKITAINVPGLEIIEQPPEAAEEGRPSSSAAPSAEPAAESSTEPAKEGVEPQPSETGEITESDESKDRGV